MMKKFYTIILATAVLFLVTLLPDMATTVLAQPGFPSPPDQVPIDGGLGILAVAGGAYAWNKLRKGNVTQE